MAKRRPERGVRGPKGQRGERGAPGITPAALRAIIADIRQIHADLEQVHADATIQFERIAQLQAQLDRALKALQEMGEKAGRSRQQRKRS